MKTFKQSAFALAAMACFSLNVQAADELSVYAFVNGEPGSGLSASLDGEALRSAGEDGNFYFDLSPGPHSLRLTRDGQTLHTVRFEAAEGQFVDIALSLEEGKKPNVDIDAYFETESALERSRAVTGSVVGYITFDNEILAGAEVTVEGSNDSVVTDEEGIYYLERPRGIYTLKIRHPSLAEPISRQVRIVGGIDRDQSFYFESIPEIQDFAPSFASGETDAAVADAEVTEPPSGVAEIVITAQRRESSFKTEQLSLGVVDTIDAEELARVGGSDVAASVIRVPSITIQSSKYVFIRGLGDRYVTTTLNGSTMPSTDPSKRTVPLDLFPNNIVSSLDVRKTFIASMPGESTGGNLIINTRTFPNQRGGKISGSVSSVSDLTGKTVFTDPANAGLDSFGIDDGTRRENGLLPLISAALEFPDEYSQSTRIELQRVGGLLIMDDLDLETSTAAPNFSLGGNYGDVFVIDDAGREFGYFAALNYSNGWSQRKNGIDRSYEGAGTLLDDFRFVERSNTIDVSGLLSLGLNDGNSSYSANSIISRNTESSVSVSEGLDGDSGFRSYRYAIDWIERQFISQQIAGEHDMDVAVAKWQATVSQADRYAPDRREVRFDLRGGDNVFNLEVPSLLRRHDELTDDNVDVSTDWVFDVPGIESGEHKLSVGAQLIMREREADSASYGLRGGQTAIDDNSPNRLVSEVINTQTISGDPGTGFAFQDETLPSDGYQAELSQYGAYLSYDALFEKHQFIAGVRFENYDQTTDTFSLQGDQGAVQSEIDESSFLPTLTYNWFFADSQQLRFAVARTVARPDFKESSNAVFYDTEFDYRVRGNPNLTISDVTNIDVRWERYASNSENLSVAFFYKDMSDPIERVVQPASGTAGNSRTFQNADSAEIYGLEFDGRKEFAINEDFTRSFLIAFNASIIESEVTLNNGDTRKLQGQPDYTANLIIGYDDIPTNQEITFLINQNGEAIQDVGVFGQPDVIEEPYLSLDINYKWRPLDNLTFKAKAANLLDSEVEFTQGGQTFLAYERGVQFQIGLDYSF